MGIARGIAEGEKLLKVGVAQPGRGAQFAPRRVVEQLADPDQSAGKRPLAARRSAPQPDQIGFEFALLNREQDGIDRDLGPRDAALAMLEGGARDCRIRAQALSSSIRSSARRAPSRTSSLSSIS